MAFLIRVVPGFAGADDFHVATIEPSNQNSRHIAEFCQGIDDTPPAFQNVGINLDCQFRDGGTELLQKSGLFYIIGFNVLFFLCHLSAYQPE